MPNERSLGIDLSRTVAIFSVVAAHTTSFKIGVFGVQLFFVLSGYLLADFQSQFTPRNFLLHRFLRLAPLAWISIFIFYFRFSSTVEIALNLLLLHSLFLNMNSFPGGWSISFEWFFSIFNLFLVKIRKASVISLLSIIILIQLLLYFYSARITNWSALLLQIATIFANLGFFICGNLIRRVNLSIKNIFLVIISFVCFPFINMEPPYILSILNIVIVCLFLLCVNFRTKLDFLSVTLHFIGKRTYGIFLGHFVILIGIENLQFFQRSNADRGFIDQLVKFLIVGVGGVIIESLTYKFIEKPLINFSSHKLRKT